MTTGRTESVEEIQISRVNQKTGEKSFEVFLEGSKDCLKRKTLTFSLEDQKTEEKGFECFVCCCFLKDQKTEEKAFEVFLENQKTICRSF